MKGWIALSLLLVPLLSVAAGAQGPSMALENRCQDLDRTFQGTTTGLPDELAGPGHDALTHELSIGSSECRIHALDATMASEDPNADFDLEVLFEGIRLGTSTQPATDERVDLAGPPWGDYTFRVQPWQVVDASYELTVQADLEPATPASGENADDPFVVVAVVDTGINPYHDEFRGDQYPTNTDDDDTNDVNFTHHPARYIEGYPEEAQAFNLSLDASSYDAAVAADDWSNVSEGTLHWLPGTKVIGAYDDGGGLDSGENVLDEDGHGTASAAVAAGNAVGACERCLIVSVEGTGGLSWALAQPWIDIVSNSWGTVGNAGIPTAGTAEADAFEALGTRIADETRSSVARGQSALFAAGNGMARAFATPQTTYTSAYTGPDWVTTVGAVWEHGGQDNCDCPEDESIIVASGKPVDVSSYALGDIPAAPHDSMHGEDQHSGTSAATPRVAGSMGQLLLHAREQVGDTIGGTRDAAIAEGEPSGTGLLEDGTLTRAELEDVTKRSAEHTQSAWVGFFPVSPPTVLTPEDQLWSQWALEGWGTVSDRTVANATAMIDGDTTVPDRPMDEQMADLDRTNREALWGPRAESVGDRPGDDPRETGQDVAQERRDDRGDRGASER